MGACRSAATALQTGKWSRSSAAHCRAGASNRSRFSSTAVPLNPSPYWRRSLIAQNSTGLARRPSRDVSSASFHPFLPPEVRWQLSIHSGHWLRGGFAPNVAGAVPSLRRLVYMANGMLLPFSDADKLRWLVTVVSIRRGRTLSMVIVPREGDWEPRDANFR